MKNKQETRYKIKMEKLNIYILDMVVEEYMKNIDNLVELYIKTEGKCKEIKEEYMKRIKKVNIDKLVKLYRKKGRNKEIEKEMVERRSDMKYEIYSSMEYIKWLFEEREIKEIEKCRYFIESVISGIENIEQIKYIWGCMNSREAYTVGMENFIYKLAENMLFEGLYILAYLEAWDVDEILRKIVAYNCFTDSYGHMDDEYRIKIFEDFKHSMTRSEYDKIEYPDEEIDSDEE